MSETQRRLARNIREIAQQKKIPISILPALCGVSKSHLYEVLNGAKGATVDWLDALARGLKVDIVDLLRK